MRKLVAQHCLSSKSILQLRKETKATLTKTSLVCTFTCLFFLFQAKKQTLGGHATEKAWSVDDDDIQQIFCQQFHKMHITPSERLGEFARVTQPLVQTSEEFLYPLLLSESEIRFGAKYGSGRFNARETRNSANYVALLCLIGRCSHLGSFYIRTMVQY